MKNKLKHKPILYTAVILAILFVILIVSAIGMFYYAFSIPEPEGLSLASWPHTFTDNFSTWIEEKDGNIGVEQIGAERLDEYGLWVQILDENGQEIYAHNKPENYPDGYSMQEMTLAVDPDLLRRAVGNIVINALVHNPVDTKVKVTVNLIPGNKIAVSVRDNGKGMDEKELSGLWSRYYRGTNTKERPESSGLGLAIAKQIIALHGGDISVVSNPGLGTEFTILLPCGASTN